MISFACIIRAAEFGVPLLFITNRLSALRDDSRHCSNEGALILLSHKMKAKIMKQGLLTITSDCGVDPVSTLLMFMRASEADWTDAEALGWYLYDLASVMIIAASEWKADGYKRSRHGDALPSAVHSKIVLRYVEEVRESVVKRDFAVAVWNRFKTEGVDLRVILLIEQQGVCVPDVAGCCKEAEVDAADVEDDWAFEAMVSVD